MARAPRTTKRKSGQIYSGDLEEIAADAAIRQMPVDDFVHKSMHEYGTYTLENRAIPAIEDGLMPSQRRTVWAMKQMGLSNKGAFVKHAMIIGETMGKYHPHGDTSLHGAGVRLAKGCPAPIIQGSGNWGSYSTKPAAMRYHEARPSALTDKIYLDPYYLRAIEYIPNYTGSEIEPVVLPCKLPMILAIEQQGIAVGVSTHVPAFTLESLRKITKYMLEGKTLTDSILAKNLEFASVDGGKVVSTKEEILQFFQEGVGPIVWECDHIIDGNKITVTGLPPDFNFRNRIESLVAVEGVVSAFNHADKNNRIRVVITLKKQTEDETKKTIDKVVKILQTRITYRINVVRRQIDKTITPHGVKSELLPMTVREVLEDWLDWRLDYLERRALLEEERLHLIRLSHLALIMKAIDNLEVIFKILKMKKVDKAVELSNAIGITIDEAREIWQIAVGRLDRLSVTDVEEEVAKITGLRKQIRVDMKDLGSSALRRGGL